MLHSTTRTATTLWVSSPRRLMAALLALTIALLVAPAPTHAASGPIISPPHPFFTTQALNTTSPTYRVVMINLGPSLQEWVGTIAVTGSFAQTNTCPRSLALGASCSIDITFRPTTAGLHTGALTRNGVAMTSLRGEAVAPEVVVKNLAAKQDPLAGLETSPSYRDALARINHLATDAEAQQQLAGGARSVVLAQLLLDAEVLRQEFEFFQQMSITLQVSLEADQERLAEIVDHVQEAYALVMQIIDMGNNARIAA